MFLRNVGSYYSHTVSYPRRQHPSLLPSVFNQLCKDTRRSNGSSTITPLDCWGAVARGSLCRPSWGTFSRQAGKTQSLITLKTEAKRPFDTSLLTRATWRHIPEDIILQHIRSANCTVSAFFYSCLPEVGNFEVQVMCIADGRIAWSKMKLPLCLTKHYAIVMHGGADV
jgi:hypothetical protein